MRPPAYVITAAGVFYGEALSLIGSYSAARIVAAGNPGVLAEAHLDGVRQLTYQVTASGRTKAWIR